MERSAPEYNLLFVLNDYRLKKSLNPKEIEYLEQLTWENEKTKLALIEAIERIDIQFKLDLENSLLENSLKDIQEQTTRHQLIDRHRISLEIAKFAFLDAFRLESGDTLGELMTAFRDKHLRIEKEQINRLGLILNDAKNKLATANELRLFIDEYQKKLEETQILSKATTLVNQFLTELETKDKDQTTVNYLKKQGLYRILYRNSRLAGEELPENDILRTLLRGGFIGVGISSLFILLFAITSLVAAPFWLAAIATGLFVGATVYLSGILYGVVNDLFATHANLPYFLLGHQPQQTSLLRTNDKIAQGVAWGVAATFPLVAIASVVFAIAATVTAFFVPVATFLLPVFIIAIPLIAVGAEFYARRRAAAYMEKALSPDEMGINLYQQRGLRYMSPTKAELAAWYANFDRNEFGFTRVPLIGLAALVSLIVLSCVSMFLPAVLIVSPLVAAVLPIAFASAASLLLLGAGLYTYVNRNTQYDDRFRLEFDRDEIEPYLYFDEDMDYIRSLEQAPVENDLGSNPVHHGSLFKGAAEVKPEALAPAGTADVEPEELAPPGTAGVTFGLYSKSKP